MSRVKCTLSNHHCRPLTKINRLHFGLKEALDGASVVFLPSQPFADTGGFTGVVVACGSVEV